MTVSPTRRDQVFALIIDNAYPLFMEAEAHLEATGNQALLDAVLKLQVDIGTEQMNDAYVNDIKDFGDPGAIDDVVKIREGEGAFFAGGDAERVVSDYKPVTVERFSILDDISAVLKKDNSPLVQDFDALLMQYKTIMASVTAPAVAFAPPKFGL